MAMRIGGCSAIATMLVVGSVGFGTGCDSSSFEGTGLPGAQDASGTADDAGTPGDSSAGSADTANLDTFDLSAPDKSDATISFAYVRTLVEAKCGRGDGDGSLCHGDKREVQNGFAYRTSYTDEEFKEALAPLIVPGEPENSKFFDAVVTGRMPKDEDLSEPQIAALRAWIESEPDLN